MAVALLLPSCHSHEDKHTHEQEHEHELESTHDHEMEHDHDHSDEILFTHAQAEAAGLALETVTPGTFRQVVKTSGQVLSSQGDEASLVATEIGRAHV